jgi:hypothetical protein
VGAAGVSRDLFDGMGRAPPRVRGEARDVRGQGFACSVLVVVPGPAGRRQSVSSGSRCPRRRDRPGTLAAGLRGDRLAGPAGQRRGPVQLAGDVPVAAPRVDGSNVEGCDDERDHDGHLRPRPDPDAELPKESVQVRGMITDLGGRASFPMTAP